MVIKRFVSCLLLVLVVGFFLTTPVVAENPRNIYSNASTAYWDENFDRAEELYKKLLEDYPDHSLYWDARFGLAQTLYKKNKLQAAKKHFNKVRSEHPDKSVRGDALFSMIEIAILMDDIVKARELLDTFLEVYPDHVLAPNARKQKKLLADAEPSETPEGNGSNSNQTSMSQTERSEPTNKNVSSQSEGNRSREVPSSDEPVAMEGSPDKPTAQPERISAGNNTNGQESSEETNGPDESSKKTRDEFNSKGSEKSSSTGMGPNESGFSSSTEERAQDRSNGDKSGTLDSPVDNKERSSQEKGSKDAQPMRVGKSTKEKSGSAEGNRDAPNVKDQDRSEVNSSSSSEGSGSSIQIPEVGESASGSGGTPKSNRISVPSPDLKAPGTNQGNTTNDPNRNESPSFDERSEGERNSPIKVEPVESNSQSSMNSKRESSPSTENNASKEVNTSSNNQPSESPSTASDPFDLESSRTIQIPELSGQSDNRNSSNNSSRITPGENTSNRQTSSSNDRISISEESEISSENPSSDLNQSPTSGSDQSANDGTSQKEREESLTKPVRSLQSEQDRIRRRMAQRDLNDTVAERLQERLSFLEKRQKQLMNLLDETASTTDEGSETNQSSEDKTTNNQSTKNRSNSQSDQPKSRTKADERKMGPSNGGEKMDNGPTGDLPNQDQSSETMNTEEQSNGSQKPNKDDVNMKRSREEESTTSSTSEPPTRENSSMKQSSTDNHRTIRKRIKELMGNGDLETAWNMQRRILDSDAKPGDYYRASVLSNEVSGNQSEAQSYLDRALSKVGSPPTRFKLQQIDFMISNGETSRASELLDRIEENKLDQLPPEYKAQYYYLRGRLRMEKNQTDEAFFEFIESVRTAENSIWGQKSQSIIRNEL